jgi:hypothetical protein
MSEQTTDAHMAAGFIDQFSDSQSETKVALNKAEILMGARSFLRDQHTVEEGGCMSVGQGYWRDIGMVFDMLDSIFPEITENPIQQPPVDVLN